MAPFKKNSHHLAQPMPSSSAGKCGLTLWRKNTQPAEVQEKHMKPKVTRLQRKPPMTTSKAGTERWLGPQVRTGIQHRRPHRRARWNFRPWSCLDHKWQMQ